MTEYHNLPGTVQGSCVTISKDGELCMVAALVTLSHCRHVVAFGGEMDEQGQVRG